MNCCARAAAIYLQWLATTRHAIDLAVQLVLTDPDCHDRFGGYFSSKFVGDEDFLIKPELVREVKDSEGEEYAQFSQENTLRLEEMFLEQGERSSFLSRDPENGKLGGATLGTELETGREVIYSIYGLSELGDEAATLGAHVLMGQLTPEKALEIAELSNNVIFKRIYDRLIEELKRLNGHG